MYIYGIDIVPIIDLFLILKWCVHGIWLDNLTKYS